MIPGCPHFLQPLVMAGFTPAGIQALTPMGAQVRDYVKEYSYGSNRQFWPLDPIAPLPETMRAQKDWVAETPKFIPLPVNERLAKLTKVNVKERKTKPSPDIDPMVMALFPPLIK